jgi:tetratricopeptide (TPR) repeat protein
VDAALTIFLNLDPSCASFELLDRALARLRGHAADDFCSRLLELPVTRVGQATPGHIDGIIYVADHFFELGKAPEKLIPLFQRAQSAAAGSDCTVQQIVAIFGEMRLLGESEALEQRMALGWEALQLISQDSVPASTRVAVASIVPLTFLIESFRNVGDLAGANEFADAALTMVGSLNIQQPYNSMHLCCRLIEFYAAIKGTKGVEASFHEAQHLTEFWTDDCYLPWAGALLAYGNFLISDGQAAKALPFLEISVKYFAREKAEDNKLDAVQSVIEALGAMGRNDEAIALAREHNLE